MKSSRIAAVLAATVAGFLALPLFLGPIHAAPRSIASAAQQSAAQAPVDPGVASYARHCAICHGDQREGILPAFPPLLGIHRQMNDEKIIDLIRTGKGRMPGFPTLPKDEQAALVKFLTAPEPVAPPPATSGARGLAEAGGALFLQNCAFCHGRDAMGGETGPDLTQSKLVLGDKTGDQISGVVREGRIEKKMPAFNFSPPELTSLVAFIRYRVTAAANMKGGRRGVAVEDLQTGNAQAGKEYFNGAGGCSKCHSPTGDLAGIATRFQGLRLEEQMLYPRDAKSKVTVTLPTGETVKGELAYQDEFTIGLKDSTGLYHSWSVSRVKFVVDSPVDAHAEQFPKYTDADVHNLMAYLQTLR